MKKIFVILFLYFIFFNISYSESKVNYFSNINTGDQITKITFGGEEKKELFLTGNPGDFERFPERAVEIPKMNKIFSVLGETKFKELFEKNIIRIYGTDFFTCRQKNVSYYYNYCIFDEKLKNLKTNTIVTKYFLFEEKDDREVDVEIYPISPDYFVYSTFYDYDNSLPRPKITFFDEAMDFYDLKLVTRGENGKVYYFNKSYKLVEYEKGYFMYIPYYTTKILLEKGENAAEISYQKYLNLNSFFSF